MRTAPMRPLKEVEREEEEEEEEEEEAAKGCLGPVGSTPMPLEGESESATCAHLLRRRGAMTGVGGATAAVSCLFFCSRRRLRPPAPPISILVL